MEFSEERKFAIKQASFAHGMSALQIATIAGCDEQVVLDLLAERDRERKEYDSYLEGIYGD